MNQPDLGLRVIELRQQKGFTQEELAEKCEASPRTIQRIESGEVNPRSYTLLWSWKKNKSYKIDRQGRQVLNFQITMTLALFAALFLIMLAPAPLIMMDNARVSEIENSPLFILLVICIPMPLILIGIFCTWQGVINAVRALSDKPIRYRLAIPFLKE